jgi:hypothetical protein
MLGIFLLFCVGVGLFAGFGLKYDQTIDVNPFYLQDGRFNAGVIVGLVIFALAFLIGIITAVIVPILFKESQERYIKTDE